MKPGYDKNFFETFANIMLRKGWKGTYCFSKKCQVMHQKCAGKTYLQAKKIMAKRTKGGVKSLIFELNAKNLEFKNFRISGTVKLLRILTRDSVQGVESLWGDCRFIPADWGS